jgi:hypothetical protein
MEGEGQLIEVRDQLRGLNYEAGRQLLPAVLTWLRSSGWDPMRRTAMPPSTG